MWMKNGAPVHAYHCQCDDSDLARRDRGTAILRTILRTLVSGTTIDNVSADDAMLAVNWLEWLKWRDRQDREFNGSRTIEALQHIPPPRAPLPAPGPRLIELEDV